LICCGFLQGFAGGTFVHALLLRAYPCISYKLSCTVLLSIDDLAISEHNVEILAKSHESFFVVKALRWALCVSVCRCVGDGGGSFTEPSVQMKTMLIALRSKPPSTN